MIVLSDTGLRKDINTVIWNDLINLKKIIEFKGTLRCNIYFRDEVEKSLDSDILLVLFGGLINFGGAQSENAAKVIRTANKFKGPVIFFGNDVLGRFDNRERDGFVRFERPVYFANPSGGKTLNVETKGLDIAGSFELNEAFMIGKELSSEPAIKTTPSYDLVYGTRVRPSLMKRLNYIADNCNMLTFGNINKKIHDSAVKLNIKMILNNSEMRVINSFGKYSVMLHEKHKDYFTNRIFEQLASNSIVLFDKSWSTYRMFWNSDNTFNSMEELLSLIKEPYSKKKVEAQHKVFRSFNFDKYIISECESVEKLI